MFDFLNQPGIIKFFILSARGPFFLLEHTHGFSVQDYLALSNDSVFQLPFFISNVPLPNYIHLFQMFRNVRNFFYLTAVNLSFSLRTLAIEIPILETRLFFVQLLVHHQLPCFDFATTVFFYFNVSFFVFFIEDCSKISYWSVTRSLNTVY